jgi:hypothetical protein
MFDQLTGAIDNRHRQFFAKAGDARQVWALDSSCNRVIYLPEDGVDEQLRDACGSGRLRCPMADCPDPRFVAKGGELRRHHFAHKVAHTRHVPAAVFRAEAVAMLADWTRHRYRGAEVATSDEGALGAVAIRSKRSGKVVTLGVTYDRSYPYWRDHDDRRHDQLLVGHTRGLLLPRAEHPRKPGVWCCGEPQLVETIIARHGAAVAVNPQERLVATLMDIGDARRSGLVPGTIVDHPNVCFVDELDACRLDGTGVVTPALDALRAWQRREAKRYWAPSRPATAEPYSAARAPQRDDSRRQQYLRRARGLDTEQRLALIKEIFLADKP